MKIHDRRISPAAIKDATKHIYIWMDSVVDMIWARAQKAFESNVYIYVYWKTPVRLCRVLRVVIEQRPAFPGRSSANMMRRCSGCNVNAETAHGSHLLFLALDETNDPAKDHKSRFADAYEYTYVYGPFHAKSDKKFR